MPTPDGITQSEYGSCRCAVGVLIEVYRAETGKDPINDLSLFEMVTHSMPKFTPEFTEWAGTGEMYYWQDSSFLAKVSAFYESNPHDFDNAAAYIMEHYEDEDNQPREAKADDKQFLYVSSGFSLAESYRRIAEWSPPSVNRLVVVGEQPNPDDYVKGSVYQPTDVYV